MKALLILLFVGCVSAIHQEALKKAADEAIDAFISGMANAPPLHLVLGIQNNEEIMRFESSLKEELEKHLREAFDKALEKINDKVKKGGKVNEEVLRQLHELKDKMKELSITDDDVGEKGLEELKNNVDEVLKMLLEKMGILDVEKRGLEDEDLLGDINVRNLILKLKNMIMEKMDPTAVKKSIAKFVGQGAERLCQWLTSRGKEKVLNFFDRLLEDDEDKKKRSVSDLYEQVKEYFDELDLDFKQKFFKFGEWVKQVLEKGLEKTKSRIENVKAIAKQLVEKSKNISKDVATQALEYLKEYKEELGELYDKVYEKLMKKIMEYTD